MSNQQLEELCRGFAGQSSLLVWDLEAPLPAAELRSEAKLPAGTAIALPLLAYALEGVRRGRYALDTPLPGEGTLERALGDMACRGAALEAVTGLVGAQGADEYFQGTLGIRDTACGPQAHTSNRSLFYVLRRLVRGEALTAPLRERLIALLPPPPAGLPGGSFGVPGRGDGIWHWAGLIPGPAGLRYVGVCTWDGPGGAEQEAGALSLLRALAGQEGG